MLPSSVKLVEVGPRDGLQNEPLFIPAEIKIQLIDKLSATGLSAIEVTSFVSPKWIPQLADSTAVFSGICQKEHVSYSALVPNVVGLEQALAVGVKEIAIFCAASETFSRKNINCSILESMQRFEAVMAIARHHAIKVRAYISCVLGCPYEGDIRPTQVASIAKDLWQIGCYEISLGDTIGVGTPIKTRKLIAHVRDNIPSSSIAVHFHDTYGQAIANIFAALEEGINVVDASVAGLGGCPYAKSASGNVSSEDVVYLLHALGIETGVDLIRLCQAGMFISNQLQRPTLSKVAKALCTDV